MREGGGSHYEVHVQVKLDEGEQQNAYHCRLLAL